jgi:hypothetical protein
MLRNNGALSGSFGGLRTSASAIPCSIFLAPASPHIPPPSPVRFRRETTGRDTFRFNAVIQESVRL